jgi:hypothetical protein
MLRHQPQIIAGIPNAAKIRAVAESEGLRNRTATTTAKITHHKKIVARI